MWVWTSTEVGQLRYGWCDNLVCCTVDKVVLVCGTLDDQDHQSIQVLDVRRIMLLGGHPKFNHPDHYVFDSQQPRWLVTCGSTLDWGVWDVDVCDVGLL